MFLFKSFIHYHLFFPGMKYMIKPLEALCVNFLLKHINQQNVFTIFQFCADCEVDKLLMEKSLSILRTEWGGAKWTFNESILKINYKCLTFLLEDEFLEIPEIKLFNEVCFFLFFGFKMIIRKEVVIYYFSTPVSGKKFF